MPLRSARIAFVLLAAAVAVGVVAYIQLADRPQPPAPENPGGPDRAGPTDPVTGKPLGKLVVLVVFDQMRGDYLARWAEHFGPGGFERIKREGVWYSEARIPYACTSTGPGHASLVSGAPPSVTGVVENEWWDRKVGKRIYCCEPARAYDRVPPLPAKEGEPARGTELGFSPERTLAETVGDRLKAATGGKGRVVSLSIKDRSAVLMGGKMPDAAYCFDTRDGTFHTGAYYRERPHPWVAEFNAEKRPDLWFDKTWERFRPDVDYAKAVGQPDDAAGEAYGFNGQGRLFPHPYRGKLTAPAPNYYSAVEASPAGNELLLELAKRAIAAERLGQGEAGDLLCLSFSSNDLIGHQFGPDSWEVFDITLRSDRVVADLLAHLDAALGKDRYTLVVSADHGVCPLPEQGKYKDARRLGMNDVYGPLTAALNATYGVPPGGPTKWFEATDDKTLDRVWPAVYLNHKSIKARGLDPEAVGVYVRDVLVGNDALKFQAAFTRKQLEMESFPPDSVGGRCKLAYHPDRSGDVIAVPTPGMLVTGYERGTSHGSPQPYDTHVPVLASGAGVPALGERGQPVSSLVVAPILAKALGVPAPVQAVEKSPF